MEHGGRHAPSTARIEEASSAYTQHSSLDQMHRTYRIMSRTCKVKIPCGRPRHVPVCTVCPHAHGHIGVDQGVDKPPAIGPRTLDAGDKRGGPGQRGLEETAEHEKIQFTIDRHGSLERHIFLQSGKTNTHRGQLLNHVGMARVAHTSTETSNQLNRCKRMRSANRGKRTRD